MTHLDPEALKNGRRKAGRKRDPAGLRRSLTVSLLAPDRARLEAIAAERGCSISAVVEGLVRACV